MMSIHEIKSDETTLKSTLTAAITGASSGLGKEYAYQLASQGINLILIARREELLNQIAEDLHARYGVNIKTICADLSCEKDLVYVEQCILETPNLEYMINCAGYGSGGIHPDVNADLQTRMILVHNVAVMSLCRAALEIMRPRKHGFIINVASVAGFLCGRGAAGYVSTKAAVISFSRALQCDCVGTGVKVQALCPGFIRTGFHSSLSMKAQLDEYEKVPAFMWSRPEWIVRASLRKVRSHFNPCVVYIPTLRYKLAAVFGGCAILAPLRWLFSGGKLR